MNAFVKIASLSIAAALIGVSAQAAELDHASQEVWGSSAPAQVKLPTRAATLVDTSRAAVKAELVRARNAGEMDFAYQDVYSTPLKEGTTTSSDLRTAHRTAK
ncbi:MAG: hypothetical protein ABW220_15210 [Burkholderiaceae bacterium]